MRSNREILLNQILIYPIKGMSGMSVSSVYCGINGPVADRRWMLTDTNGLFMSQRTHPQLSLFKISSEHHQFHISYRNKTINIPLRLESGEKIPVKIFQEEVNALLAAREINDWFSRTTGTDCNLVYLPDESLRKVQLPNDAVHHYGFADAFPLLLMGSASAAQISDKFQREVSHSRFRPNLLFSTSVPHEEDSWGSFKLGTATLMPSRPCARCQVINVDQETGTRNKEVLKTLASYRTFNHQVFMGMNTLILKPGLITVGDRIIFNNPKA